MAPVDHKYVAPGLDVSVTLPPAHIVVGPEAVIVGAAGKATTVTVMGSDSWLSHPAEFVTCTVKFPDVVTLILRVIAPVDHKYVVAELDVRVTLPPSQKERGPEGVIDGLAGNGLTITETCLFIVENPSLTAT